MPSDEPTPRRGKLKSWWTANWQMCLRIVGKGRALGLKWARALLQMCEGQGQGQYMQVCRAADRIHSSFILEEI